MSTLKAVYVSGPYTSPTEQGRHRNIHKAWELALAVWGLQNCYAICPHINTMHMGGACSDDGQEDYNKFIESDCDIIRRCDAVLMMRGWENSRGACIERRYAYNHGIPVFYEEWEGLRHLQEWAIGLRDAPLDESSRGCNSTLCSLTTV